jgi:hypothetical protein
MIKGVTGWPSDLTVLARVIDRTANNTDVPWTPTGVTETKNGIGYSAYDFNFTPMPDHAYLVSFKDNSATPYSQDIIISENETMIIALEESVQDMSSTVNAIAYIMGSLGTMAVYVDDVAPTRSSFKISALIGFPSDFCKGSLVIFRELQAGVNALGISREIISFDSGTGLITVDRDFPSDVLNGDNLYIKAPMSSIQTLALEASVQERAKPADIQAMNVDDAVFNAHMEAWDGQTLLSWGETIPWPMGDSTLEKYIDPYGGTHNVVKFSIDADNSFKEIFQDVILEEDTTYTLKICQKIPAGASIIWSLSAGGKYLKSDGTWSESPYYNTVQGWGNTYRTLKVNFIPYAGLTQYMIDYKSGEASSKIFYLDSISIKPKSGALLSTDSRLDKLDLIADIHDETFGRWVIDPVENTLTLYRVNGDVLQVFDLTKTTAQVPAYIGRSPQ